MAAIVLGPPDPRREVPDHSAGSGDASYGQRLLGKIKALFRAWHRRGQTPEMRWQRAIAKMRAEVLAVARRAPMRTEAQNMAKRFRDHGDAYFTFLDTPGIEPTNNGPERQIRFLAIDRKITQGTRGEAGRRWCERIWTMLATVLSKAVPPSSSSTIPSSPTSPTNLSPPSCLYLRDRLPVLE